MQKIPPDFGPGNFLLHGILQIFPAREGLDSGNFPARIFGKG